MYMHVYIHMYIYIYVREMKGILIIPYHRPQKQDDPFNSLRIHPNDFTFSKIRLENL